MAAYERFRKAPREQRDQVDDGVDPDQSLKTDGRFNVDPTFFSSLAAEYYYGVSFLDQIGYWKKAQRFWTDDEFPDAIKKCELIVGRVAELPLHQWEAREALRRLDRNCGQPREN